MMVRGGSPSGVTILIQLGAAADAWQRWTRRVSRR
jgi:hypothetical protein